MNHACPSLRKPQMCRRKVNREKQRDWTIHKRKSIGEFDTEHHGEPRQVCVIDFKRSASLALRFRYLISDSSDRKQRQGTLAFAKTR